MKDLLSSVLILFSASLLFFSVFTILVSAVPTIDTIGSNAHSATGIGLILASPVTASANGTLSTVGFNIGAAPTCKIRLGIYSNSANKPYILLGQSDDTVAVAGWNDLPVGFYNVSVVAGAI